MCEQCVCDYADNSCALGYFCEQCEKNKVLLTFNYCQHHRNHFKVMQKMRTDYIVRKLDVKMWIRPQGKLTRFELRFLQKNLIIFEKNWITTLNTLLDFYYSWEITLSLATESLLSRQSWPPTQYGVKDNMSFSSLVFHALSHCVHCFVGSSCVAINTTK